MSGCVLGEGHGGGGDGEHAPAAHRPARSSSLRGGEAGAILTIQQIIDNPIQYQLQSVILGAKSWLGELSVPVVLDNFSVSVPAPREEARQSLCARLRSLVCGKSRPARMVLENITAHFEPGRMCLVVGGPQCGKSTLLRAIADRLPRECKQHGETRINGHTRSAVSPGYLRQVLGYVPPTDEHVPVLTVEETLSFAYDLTCSTYLERVRKQTSVSVPSGTRPKVHLLLHLFGLSSCRQTRIGDSRVRGVSGGEKKRITVAEQLVRTYPVCCMDEISTGLDAKVTLDIITALRTEVDLLKTTRIIALLQPPPAVYELFDDILLLGVGGRLVYHGPLEIAKHYFAELGFLCPANVDLLEFLVDVCNENGVHYYHAPDAADSGASAAAPRRWFGADAPDSAALSHLWRASSLGAHAVEQAQAREDAVRPQAAANRDVGVGGWLGWIESSEVDFGASWARSLQVLTVRHATILWRDVIFVRQRLLQAFMQACLLGTIFWQAGEPRHGQAGSESGGTQDDGLSGHAASHPVFYRDHVKMAVIFLVCGVQMTSSISILEVINAKRPLFYKLRDAQFFPTLVYTLSEGVAELPLQLVDSSILATITFFAVGMHTPTFPVFFTAVLGSNVMNNYMWKAVMANVETRSLAQSVALLVVAISIYASGFFITFNSIAPCLRWLHWITPLPHIIKMLSANEFLSAGPGARYDKLMPVGRGEIPTCLYMYGANTQMKRVGDLYLESYDLPADPGLVSTGWAYMICSTLVAFVCYTLGLHLRRLGGAGGAAVRRDGASVQRARTLASPNAALGSGMNGAQDKEHLQTAVPLDSVALHVEPCAMRESAAACTVVLRDVHLFVPSASASDPSEKGTRWCGTGCESGGCESASSRGQIRLLHNITAVFEPGSIVALMGPSGAGKTSLLNLIACRLRMNSPGARVEGLVSCLVHASSPDAPAQRVDGMAFSHMCGYVEQEPTLFPLMTVREALAFSARLRLPDSMSAAQRVAMVDSVVDLMELHSVLDQVFINRRAGAAGGSPAACPLGAEVLKLVCIAVELVANPSILLMDEPTSGLDSRGAKTLMRVLGRVAASGRTIICSIHQPSSELFAMFDKVVLLDRGQLVYNDDLRPRACGVASQETQNTGSKLAEYFHSVNPKCGRMAAGGNPASYMLHALATSICDDGTTPSGPDAGDVHGTECADSPLQPVANRDYWPQAYASSAMCAQQRLKVEERLAQSESGGEIARHSASRKRCRPLWLQLGALVGRWWRLLYRDVSYTYSRLFVMVLVALLFSAVAGVPQDQPSVHSYSGSLVLGVLFSSSINSMLVIPLITETMLVLNKEQAAYMYHASIYGLALNIAELPFVVLNSLVNLSIFYPLAGLYPAVHYVVYYGVALTLFQIIFLDYGCMLAAVFKVTRRAALFCSASMSIFNFFCGFFFSESDMQYPGRLLYYISLSRLGLSTILPPNFYCSASCFLTSNIPGDAVGTGGPSQGQGCQMPGPSGEVLERLAGEGPGCRIIDDLSGRVLSKMGDAWAKERLNVDVAALLPLRMTIWDYWSTLSDASMHWMEPMLAMVVASLVMKLITAFFLKQASNRSMRQAS